MIIDFHTHVAAPWLRERRAEHLGLDPCFDELYSNPKARLASTEELIESMDRAEVDVSVILNIGWCSHDMCVSTNDYLLESVAQHPRRLVGFCAVQPAAGDLAAREAERCAAGGARGLGELRPDTQGFRGVDPARLAPLADVVSNNRLIILTHASEPVGHQYPGKGTAFPDVLCSLIGAFKDAVVVCAHWGGGLPFYGLMPEVGRSLENVYFDTAATRYLYKTSIYTTVAQVVGVEHILMGSDFPLIAQDRQVQEVRSLDASPDLKASVLGGNARRLLGLEPG